MSDYSVRACVLLAATLTFAGCDDLEFGRTGGPLGNEAQTAADAAADLDNPAEAEAPKQASEAAPSEPPKSTSGGKENEDSSGTHVDKTTKEVLNAKKLKEDPNWTIAASEASEVKGFTAAGTAYNRAAALSGTANLDKWLQMQHAVNGSYPTYGQLTDYLEKNPADMPALREYQYYGYDESTGEMVILENKQEKKQRRGELGIEQ